MFRRVGLCPGGKIFQRFDDSKSVLVALDGITPGDLQLPEFAPIAEDIGVGLSFRDCQRPAGITGEIVPVQLLVPEGWALLQPR